MFAMKNSKDFILQTAYTMFLCSNYEAVTFSTLSKATGLTKGAIYHHFPSKEALFKAVVDKYLIEKKIDFSVPHNNLHDFIQYIVDKAKIEVSKAMSTNQEAEKMIPLQFVSLSIEAFRHYPGYAEIGSSFHQSQIKNWAKALQKAVDAGEIRDDIDIEIMASNFMALGTSVVTNMMLNNSVASALEIFEKQIFELYKAIKK